MLHTITNANFRDQAGVSCRKAVRNSLAFLTAGMVMGGVAQAQDKTPAPHQIVATNSIAATTWERDTEPTIEWGSRTRVSGLIVDLIKSHQTWLMLNPPSQARYLSAPIPAYLQPVQIPLTMNEKLEVSEPDFALFSISF